MGERLHRDALMAKWTNMGPAFVVTYTSHIEYWRWRGFFLLADEREIRCADVQDVRESEEKRPGWTPWKLRGKDRDT